MAAFSKLTPRNSALLTAVAAGSFLVYKNIADKRARGKEADIKVVIHETVSQKKERAAVDGIFFRRLFKILKVLIPGWFTAEAWYMFLVAAALIARTYADVWMIQNGTSIESAIIGRDMELFKKYLFKFIYAMPLISCTNNALKYGLNELKLRFRTRLSENLYQKYLQGFTYYKMCNLDNRISNPDQLLTQDVDKFCDSVAELYSNLSKPILDVILYTVKLAGSIGIQGPAKMLVYLAVSGLILTRLRRPVGKLTVIEQRLEGEYRYVNSRLITNSEEIAFYQGNKREQFIILATFRKLVNHLRHFISFRLQMGFVDNIVAKLRLVPGFVGVQHMGVTISLGFILFRQEKHPGKSFTSGSPKKRVMSSAAQPFAQALLQEQQGEGIQPSLPSQFPFLLQWIGKKARVLQEEGGTILAKGMVEEVPMSECIPSFYYRMFLVRKKSVARRLIIGDSAFNRHIDSPRFKMETPQGIIFSVQDGMWATSVDLKDAPSALTFIAWWHVQVRWFLSFLGYLNSLADVVPLGRIHIRPLQMFLLSNWVPSSRKWEAVQQQFDYDNPSSSQLFYPSENVDYYKSGRMLVRMAEAIGRIVLAGREMTRLAGFTSRITELMRVLDDLNKGRYERTMVSEQNKSKDEQTQTFKAGTGQIVNQDHLIKFDKVPLVTPNGDVLIKELTFEVRGGMNVLVCGPNGCGKSSLFRVLGELWPLFGGTLTKPEKGNLFYVPQVQISLFTVSHRKSLWKHHEYYLKMDGRGAYEYKRITSDTTEFGS
ncbi:ATP-binding cassette sub-family D member 3-like [Ylistrum balloti]|uniref:ATP-binding cassette sub-family D member 3-like n=1 Tax=Ylistrum balloti TaxID=509963 RepID=UPI002905DDDD|nr:ATP-binding cassette sub-family D member 3-like [Ylistrum balloti]